MNEVALGSPDAEGDLGRLTPAPVPPGLRGRVMGRAAQTRKHAALTPRLRIAAVVCAVLILVVLGVEPILGKLEAMQIAALFDGGPGALATGMTMTEVSELADLTGIQGAEAAWLIRSQARFTRAERRRRFGEDLKGLRGWLEYEASEIFN
jgi:hypothetical protein